MKNLSTKSNSIKTKLLVYLMAVVLLFSGVGITLLTNNFGSGGNDAGAVEVIYDTTDGLGRYPNGTSYMFTDRTKVDAFRAGTIDKDTTFIKVNSSATWGTQANPIVLATYDDCVKFVKHCANNYNNTRNKYYVLANDIDFSGKTFYAITMFGGTFYGNGHALKNITCSSWTVCLNGNDFISMTGSNTSSMAGVF